MASMYFLTPGNFLAIFKHGYFRERYSFMGILAAAIDAVWYPMAGVVLKRGCRQFFVFLSFRGASQ